MIFNIIKIYFLLLIIKLILLDKIDQIALKNMLLSKLKLSYYSTNSSIRYLDKLIIDKFKKIYYLLFLPFNDNNYLITHTSGSIYTSYIVRYYPKLSKDLQNKFTWYKTFKENNINHPKIIAYNYKNESKILENIINEKKYILKPIVGEQGYDVQIIKGNQIKKMLKEKKDVIIQQLLKDCSNLLCISL